MDIRLKKIMKEIGGEKIQFDAPMRKYTTLHVGGNAEALYRADNLEELREMIAFIMDKGIPYLVIGKGSNLLVKDGGLNGLAIIFEGPFSNIEQITTGEPYVSGGAGLSLQKLVSFCAEKGLAGVEFLAGIPGTMGGAVAMNAGSWGEEVKDVISEVTTLSAKGIVEKKTSASMNFTYRGLDLDRGEIILCAMLKLRLDEPASIKKRVAFNIKQRKEKFPLDMPSAGSIFKNPEGDYAGRLIDAVGLKGEKNGGAMISPMHANFIVNTGKASASDMLDLMDLAAARVKDMFNIQLVPEIKIVGKS
ncbi:MAG TPA: UDP-N-acetylmuramate dehydrogenase [Desulfatiglandales bacterium]|nr:UDP-N-acetylmuramate dehydrogenase [Desulfatiglandales bacterium]